MATYTLQYSNDGIGRPGRLDIEAANDKAAIKAANDDCEERYRNQSWVSVRLSDGRAWIAHNQHGRAVGHYQ